MKPHFKSGRNRLFFLVGDIFMQSGVRHRKEVSRLTQSNNIYFCKACLRSPRRNSGCLHSPEGNPRPWTALASHCLDSPENDEILAFEPRILF